MKNNSISDFVAASMDAVLKSEEHKSLFGSQYKFASDENAAKCEKCQEEVCSCDSSEADDEEWDSASASDSEEDSDEFDSASASDSEEAEEEDSDSASAFDVAIDSLLTASAALDSINLGRGSALSLKLASLVVEAKQSASDKKKTDDAKAKAKKEKEKAAEKKKKEMEKAKADKAKADDKKKAEKAKADKKKADEAAKKKKSDSNDARGPKKDSASDKSSKDGKKGGFKPFEKKKK
jgi:hypothetical protein